MLVVPRTIPRSDQKQHRKSRKPLPTFIFGSNVSCLTPSQNRTWMIHFPGELRPRWFELGICTLGKDGKINYSREDGFDTNYAPAGWF